MNTTVLESDKIFNGGIRVFITAPICFRGIDNINLNISIDAVRNNDVVICTNEVTFCTPIRGRA